MVVGGGLVLVFAVAYPIVASRTESPLAIFVVPILAVAVLGTVGQTAAVGAVATAVAAVEGVVVGDLDGAALAARLTIIAITWGFAVVLSVERVRRQRQLDEAHERSVLMDAFQSSLAPVPAPPPGVRVQVRFRFGDDRLQLGGDFLDAIELPDGALGYIIGDVCGHGVRSAALGSAMRTGWKTIATHAPEDPTLWVEALEQAFFRLGRREGYVTLNTGRLDVADRRLRYVSAGHPWPIVVGERVELAHPNVSPPVGLFRGTGRRPSQLELPPRATLVLYTDGLYEHPDAAATGADGEAALLRYVELNAGALDVDAMLDHFGRHGYQDDVALMAIAPAGA